MDSIKVMKEGIRNSRMFLNEVYFWTDTIKDWKSLLAEDKFKQIIIDSWQTLVQRKKIVIYGFVIMPNHLHVIWEMLSLNGKEMPHASFNKFTSHQFLQCLRSEGRTSDIAEYLVAEDAERKHRFWQRDALAVNMDSQSKVEQKLDYIHLNPMHERWNFVSKPEDYYWSSAKFYENGVDDFGIVTHYRDRF
jgi:putative transposase